jgi:hypothetical protein
MKIGNFIANGILKYAINAKKTPIIEHLDKSTIKFSNFGE